MRIDNMYIGGSKAYKGPRGLETFKGSKGLKEDRINTQIHYQTIEVINSFTLKTTNKPTRHLHGPAMAAALIGLCSSLCCTRGCTSGVAATWGFRWTQMWVLLWNCELVPDRGEASLPFCREWPRARCQVLILPLLAFTLTHTHTHAVVNTSRKRILRVYISKRFYSCNYNLIFALPIIC